MTQSEKDLLQDHVDRLWKEVATRTKSANNTSVEDAVRKLYDPIDNISSMPSNYKNNQAFDKGIRGIAEQFAEQGVEIDWSDGTPRTKSENGMPGVDMSVCFMYPETFTFIEENIGRHDNE